MFRFFRVVLYGNFREKQRFYLKISTYSRDSTETICFLYSFFPRHVNISIQIEKNPFDHSACFPLWGIHGTFFLLIENCRTHLWNTLAYLNICLIQLAYFLWVAKSKSETQILNCINKTILWQGPFLVNDTIKESQTLPNFCSFWNGRTHLPTAGLWQKIALLHLGCLHHFLLICLIFKYIAK